MGSVASLDAKNGSVGAMPGVAGNATRTRPAAGIDLADNAPPYEFRRGIGPFDDADKFMADRPFKIRIPADDLKVRAAYTGIEDSYQRFAVRLRWDVSIPE